MNFAQVVPTVLFVSNLATGTYGSTVEPCQSLQRKMPLGEVFVPYYTTGFPLGPSAWASVRTPGGGTLSVIHSQPRSPCPAGPPLQVAISVEPFSELFRAGNLVGAGCAAYNSTEYS